MAWKDAIELILISNHVGTDLNTPRSTYRIILDEPPYQCRTYGYIGQGFRVKIGLTTEVEIPLDMLENCYLQATNNRNIYNNAIFGSQYERQKINHPWHVHVVGKIFQVAGVAETIDNNNYLIVV